MKTHKFWCLDIEAPKKTLHYAPTDAKRGASMHFYRNLVTMLFIFRHKAPVSVSVSFRFFGQFPESGFVDNLVDSDFRTAFSPPPPSVRCRPRAPASACGSIQWFSFKKPRDRQLTQKKPKYQNPVGSPSAPFYIINIKIARTIAWACFHHIIMSL